MARTGTTTYRICAWSGVAFAALFLLGFGVLAGFVPPPSPQSDSEQIAQIFRESPIKLRAGLVITSFCSALLLPWFALISAQMKRIEGDFSPLAYLQMTAGSLAVLEFIFPTMVWQAAAFRPERSAEILQTLNDVGWLPFLGIVSTAIVQGIAIGLAILQDERENPIFPRWAGYFNIWMISMLAPGGIIVFFKSGPLAWNGLIGFWLLLLAYMSWIVVDTVLLLRTADVRAPSRVEVR
jgi:hypothetical protein